LHGEGGKEREQDGRRGREGSHMPIYWIKAEEERVLGEELGVLRLEGSWPM